MKFPFLQLYTGDWRTDPNLSMCSPATRGIWIDLLCAMHENGRSGQVTGTVEQLCRVCRCTAAEMSAAIAELRETKTANVCERDGKVTVTSRRMQREASGREQARQRKENQRDRGILEVEEKARGSDVSRNGHAAVTDILHISDKTNTKSVRAKPPPDERSKHVAIQAVRKILGRYPNRLNYDKLIVVLGESPEQARLTECATEWAARGFKLLNLAWVYEWYVNGIPERKQNGGNGYGQANRIVGGAAPKPDKYKHLSN